MITFFAKGSGLDHLKDFLADSDDLTVNEALTALDELTVVDSKEGRRNEDLIKLIEEKQIIAQIESYLEKNKNVKEFDDDEMKKLREANLQYVSYLKNIWNSVMNSDPRAVPEDPVDRDSATTKTDGATSKPDGATTKLDGKIQPLEENTLATENN